MYFKEKFLLRSGDHTAGIRKETSMKISLLLKQNLQYWTNMTWLYRVATSMNTELLQGYLLRKQQITNFKVSLYNITSRNLRV